jgi:E1A/CREB-binding protein
MGILRPHVADVRECVALQSEEHKGGLLSGVICYYKTAFKVHKWCTRLSEIFIEEINPVMRQMGYCCGQKLSFTPLVQFCFGITKNNAACVIARDQPYFMYENSSSNFGLTVAERYIYCVKCFETLPDQGINLNENTTDPPKSVT